MLNKGFAFQPTPPVWGATLGDVECSDVTWISTHAPRVGGDLSNTDRGDSRVEFQPTPPVRGATFFYSYFVQIQIKFQPTPPVRGATRLEGV